jgi:hypothetical protein
LLRLYHPCQGTTPIIVTKLVDIASTRNGPVGVVLIAAFLYIAAIVSGHLATTYAPENIVLVAVLFIHVSACPISVAYDVNVAHAVRAKEATHVIVAKLINDKSVNVGPAGVVQKSATRNAIPPQ